MQLINECVATVLELELTATIEGWMKRVNKVPELISIPLSYQERTGHLPQLLHELIIRLRLKGAEELPETSSAHDHGKNRFDQGYSIPMLVEESRLLQVSIFETLHINRKSLDSNMLLAYVMIIADECDGQLKQSVETFMDLDKHSKGATA